MAPNRQNVRHRYVQAQCLKRTTIVAASSNDPLGTVERVAELARNWGGRLVELGAVGHLNPASGHGPWPRAEELLRELEHSWSPGALPTD
ncbi:alpha/beta hydrolase [Streptomyces sp. NBC_01214]|uniref:RBBP9/YdeN family alpha/beta hydrolase n=1 Tax=Streptomyces sp. NBC_01214 TaxID=2903777 RepID=UPI0022520DAD|nr:alpha/beta hydrolase [Streptomyces sp. NBC_01214]MCX4807629.1 alpha/beta hydrolase [Streptomyces sp. NBC_01214]